MNRFLKLRGWLSVLLLAAVPGLLPSPAHATIIGVTDTSATPRFTLRAKADAISTSDGDSMWMWGYAVGTHHMQYPGPTLIVNQGAQVTVVLQNELPVPVSIVFPGQQVSAVGGQPGQLTREVAPGATGAASRVVYRFTASQPGTYLYYSGTRADLEVEMGLVGTLIVRPSNYASMQPKQAYADSLTAYDREYLFVLSDADPVIHQQVAFATFGGGDLAGKIAAIDMSKRHPTDWFMNGRNFPDTLTYPTPRNNESGYPSGSPVSAQFPNQPYNAFPQMHPGERVLMRMVGAGLDLHPLHTHGQNHLVVARDARVLSSDGTVPDLAVSDYTTSSVPGETADAIWGPWTGEKLGWDVYGTAAVNPHTCSNPACPDADGDGFNDSTGEACIDAATQEYCPDHYKPIPVALPSNSVLSFGVAGPGFYSGSPYLGVPGALPVLNPDGSVHVQDNPLAGLSYMWHSHNERELTTNDIFPGGMATMALVVPVEGTSSVCPPPTGPSNPCYIW